MLNVIAHHVDGVGMIDLPLPVGAILLQGP